MSNTTTNDTGFEQNNFDKIKNIATALVKAQKAFGPALKTSTNPHFRSRYADLSACVEAVIGGLNDNGIALIQQLHESANGVTVETVFIHESGEMLNCGKMFVPAIKQDAQGFGSALTYARRYSLMAACGIAPEDDDGNAASKKPTVDEKEKKPKAPSSYSFEGLPYQSEYLLTVLKDLIGAIKSEESYVEVATALKRNSKELERFKEDHKEDGAVVSAMFKRKVDEFKEVK